MEQHENAARFEVRVTSDSHFAWIRTRLAIERTMMSWVRTSTALIGFGFTIVQFFARLQSMDGVEAARHPEMARYLGLALIAAGILSVAISSWQYHWLNKYLWSQQFSALAGVQDGPHGTPLLSVAVSLMLIGLFAFFSVLLRFV